jgi:predicted nucleic acid-binding protein
MGLNLMRAYLDACVTIYYVERHPVLGSQVAAALFPDPGEEVTPVYSDLTRLECRVQPLRNRDQDLLSRYETFFSLPQCSCVSLGADVFDMATELRAQFALRTPDALHLAAAIHSGCDQFWTQDNRLAKAAAHRIQVIVFDTSTSGDPHV